MARKLTSQSQKAKASAREDGRKQLYSDLIPLVPLSVGRDTYQPVAGSSVRPNITTGVGFGDYITDDDREYAAQREPIAHFATEYVGSDIFTNWFTINDLNTEAPDDELDQEVQAELEAVKAREAFTTAAIWERIHGSAYIVMALDDAETEEALEKPAREAALLTDLAVYPKTKVKVVEAVTDTDSPDWGQALIYELDRGSQRKTRVHASRVIKLQTRHNGASVLDPIWDDLTCLRNIRYGMAQTIFRHGSGFPCVTVKDATLAQLQAYAEGGLITNLMSRTMFLGSDAVSIDFKGALGAALNPLPYYTPIIENISAGTKIPAAILRGVQAGALTGSEVNEREYASYIRSLQKLYEEPLRIVIDKALLAANKAAEYEVEWASVVHLSDLSEADLALKEEQINEKRLLYMTVDEVRERAGLKPIGGEQGAIIPGLARPAEVFPGGIASPAAPGGTPEEPSASEPASAPREPSTVENPLIAASPDSNNHNHSNDARNAFEHPELIAGLKEIVHRVKRRELSKESALEQARAIINAHIDAEISSAKAYLAARTGKPMPMLPTERASGYEKLRASYMVDFNTILEDAIARKAAQ